MESTFLSLVGMKQKMLLTWLGDIGKTKFMFSVVFETELIETLKERDQSSHSKYITGKTISVTLALLEYYWDSTAWRERKREREGGKKKTKILRLEPKHLDRMFLSFRLFTPTHEMTYIARKSV